MKNAIKVFGLVLGTAFALLLGYLLVDNYIFPQKSKSDICKTLKVGMPREQIIAIMGKPNVQRNGSSISSEMIYSDGIGESASTAIELDKTTNISIVIYCGDGGYVFEDVNGNILPSDYMTKRGAGGAK